MKSEFPHASESFKAANPHLFGSETQALGSSTGTDLESDLQDAIAAECRRRGWPYINARRDRASTISVGAPDFVIGASNARTLWIETKSATGKQTPEQIGWQRMLTWNGHSYHLVRSFKHFLEIADSPR